MQLSFTPVFNNGSVQMCLILQLCVCVFVCLCNRRVATFELPSIYQLRHSSAALLWDVLQIYKYANTQIYKYTNIRSGSDRKVYHRFQRKQSWRRFSFEILVLANSCQIWSSQNSAKHQMMTKRNKNKGIWRQHSTRYFPILESSLRESARYLPEVGRERIEESKIRVEQSWDWKYQIQSLPGLPTAGTISISITHRYQNKKGKLSKS